MLFNKIDSAKFFINSSQPAKPKETPKPQVQTTKQDEDISNATKYMIGATALAATIAIGIIGHKNNWWKSAINTANNGYKDITSYAAEASKPSKLGINQPINANNTPSVTSTAKTEHSNQIHNQSTLEKIKDTLTSPLKRIKEHREAKKLSKEVAQNAKREKIKKELLEKQKLADDQLREHYAKSRQRVINDEPERKARIAQQEQQYAQRIKQFWKKDFGDIDTEHVIEDYNYANVKKYIKTNPEYFVPAPKKGEYDFRHLAVDGYWNGPKSLGASNGTFIPGTELHYDNQFTLHDRAYPQMKYNELTNEQLHNTHWAMQKVALNSPYNGDKRIHIGTALRFSAPEHAVESSRPLGWNIFIEGDISINKMREIKKHLVKSGVWARQLAIQDNDSMIEVFNEIIKCLNK